MLLVMRMFWTTRYRIESAFMERVTARDAFDREPRPSPDAVGFNGIHRVMRARRIETAARPEQRADGELVPADQSFQDEAHVLATRCQRVARLARSVAAGASRAGIFAATTMSTAGRPCCASRKVSRIRRRRRLRGTAPPTAFTATARPMRG